MAEVLSAREDYEGALPYQDESLRIMRDLSAAFPDDPWYKLDVVRALDQRAMLLQDRHGRKSGGAGDAGSDAGRMAASRRL